VKPLFVPEKTGFPITHIPIRNNARALKLGYAFFKRLQSSSSKLVAAG
jgi:hypothetical protein